MGIPPSRSSCSPCMTLGLAVGVLPLLDGVLDGVRTGVPTGVCVGVSPTPGCTGVPVQLSSLQVERMSGVIGLLALSKGCTSATVWISLCVGFSLRTQSRTGASILSNTSSS